MKSKLAVYVIIGINKKGLDRSVFDVQATIFNTGSGTYIRIHGFGITNNTLVN